MNRTLQLVLGALQALAAIAVNPALGLSTKGVQIAQLLGLITAFGNEGEQAHQELIALTDQIKGLEAAGGPIPTDVWDMWEAKLDGAHARLQALKTG